MPVMTTRRTRMPPRGLPEGERRERLLKQALEDAVEQMIRHGQTPEELRDQRLDGTLHLLFEIDPAALGISREAAEHALSMPRIRMAKTSSGTPFHRALMLIHANPDTDEAKAFAALLRAMGADGSFRESVALCRENVQPDNRLLIFEILEQYVAMRADSALNDTLYMLDNIPHCQPPAEEPQK